MSPILIGRFVVAGVLDADSVVQSTGDAVLMPSNFLRAAKKTKKGPRARLQLGRPRRS